MPAVQPRTVRTGSPTTPAHEPTSSWLEIGSLQQPPNDIVESNETYHEYWKKPNLEKNDISRLQDQKENTTQSSTNTESKA